jgi:hypothetical protein
VLPAKRDVASNVSTMREVRGPERCEGAWA